MRPDTITAQPPLFPSVPRRKREVREPYDGLRPWSAITHGLGAVLALAGTIYLLLRTAAGGNWLLFGLMAVYGLSMVCLYTASTLYHCLRVSVPGRLALRKYDHCSIYLLIAGSYTPLCLTALRDSGGPVLLALVWSVGVVGMILTITKLSIPRWLTSAIYLFMGWLAIFAIGPIHSALSSRSFFWLMAGAAMYTVGGVLYAVKWPGRDNPRFGCHEIFHVFILLGSICHFVMMYQLL